MCILEYLKEIWPEETVFLYRWWSPFGFLYFEVHFKHFEFNIVPNWHIVSIMIPLIPPKFLNQTLEQMYFNLLAEIQECWDWTTTDLKTQPKELKITRLAFQPTSEVGD